MKLKYYFLSLALCSMAAVTLSSCHDDDDTVIVEEETPDALVPGVETMRVKIGEPQSLPVVSGAGEYHAFVLDETVAAITEENGQLMVNGLKNGNTTIVITDAAGQYMRLPLSIYTTDVMTLNMNEVTVITPLGYSASNNEVAVELGNGEYSIVSDNDHVRATIDKITGAVSITATSRMEEYNATLTVSDISGLTALISVTVKATFDPFTADELAELAASTEVAVDYNGSEPTYFYYYKMGWGYGEMQDKIEEGTESIGYIYAGYYSNKCLINFPEGTAVDKEVEGTMVWKGGYYGSDETYNGKVKVIADNATTKVVIWWNVDTEAEKLNRGYVVYPKPAQ